MKTPVELFINSYHIYLFGTGVGGHTRAKVCTREVRGQVEGVSSFLLPCETELRAELRSSGLIAASLSLGHIASPTPHLIFVPETTFGKRFQMPVGSSTGTTQNAV